MKGLRRMRFSNRLDLQMECAKHCRLYGKFQLYDQSTCECVDGDCDKEDGKGDHSSLYTVTKGKSHCQSGLCNYKRITNKSLCVFIYIYAYEKLTVTHENSF